MTVPRDSGDAYRDALLDVVLASTRLSDPAQRLTVLSTAWLLVASQARSQQLFAQGGYETEQRRQLQELDKLARLVREDVPDFEYERLLREGNFDSLLEYLRRKRDDLAGGAL